MIRDTSRVNYTTTKSNQEELSTINIHLSVMTIDGVSTVLDYFRQWFSMKYIFLSKQMSTCGQDHLR